MSAMEREDTQSSQEHENFAPFSFQLLEILFPMRLLPFGKTFSNNSAFRRRAGMGFNGCASNRFTLAMKDIMQESDDLLVMVQMLIKELISTTFPDMLRKHTQLKVLTQSEIR